MKNESKYLLQQRIRNLEQENEKKSKEVWDLRATVNELTVKIRNLEPKEKIEYIVTTDTSLQPLFDELKKVLDTMKPELQKTFIAQLENLIRIWGDVMKGKIQVPAFDIVRMLGGFK